MPHAPSSILIQDIPLPGAQPPSILKKGTPFRWAPTSAPPPPCPLRGRTVVNRGQHSFFIRCTLLILTSPCPSSPGLTFLNGFSFWTTPTSLSPCLSVSKGPFSSAPMSAAVAGVPRLPPGRKPPGPPPGPPPPQVLALYGSRRPQHYATDTGNMHTYMKPTCIQYMHTHTHTPTVLAHIDTQ